MNNEEVAEAVRGYWDGLRGLKPQNGAGMAKHIAYWQRYRKADALRKSKGDR